MLRRGALVAPTGAALMKYANLEITNRGEFPHGLKAPAYINKSDKNMPMYFSNFRSMYHWPVLGDNWSDMDTERKEHDIHMFYTLAWWKLGEGIVEGIEDTRTRLGQVRRHEIGEARDRLHEGVAVGALFEVVGHGARLGVRELTFEEGGHEVLNAPAVHAWSSSGRWTCSARRALARLSRLITVPSLIERVSAISWYERSS